MLVLVKRPAVLTLSTSGARRCMRSIGAVGIADSAWALEFFHLRHSLKGDLARLIGGRIRPHSSLGYRPPAPETILPPASALPYAALRPDQTLANSGRTQT